MCLENGLPYLLASLATFSGWEIRNRNSTSIPDQLNTGMQQRRFLVKDIQFQLHSFRILYMLSCAARTIFLVLKQSPGNRAFNQLMILMLAQLAGQLDNTRYGQLSYLLAKMTVCGEKLDACCCVPLRLGTHCPKSCFGEMVQPLKLSRLACECMCITFNQ